MNKYGAKKTVVDGITFDSKKEANRYRELSILNNAGEIALLELQPRYDIIVNGKRIGFYKADFRYRIGQRIIVEDVKGCKKGCAYQMFRLKKKLVEAIYGLEIIEI